MSCHHAHVALCTIEACGHEHKSMAEKEIEIREDERKKVAREILEAMDKSGRVLQPGMWFAASLLDPSVRDNF